MELHQNVEKFLHLREKVVENSRLAPNSYPANGQICQPLQTAQKGGPIYWLGGQSIGHCGTTYYFGPFLFVRAV